jgi:predicted transcriptional regulator
MSYVNKKIFNTLSKKSDTNHRYAQTESDGLSVAKVLSTISDDISLSLFKTIAISSNPISDGQQPIDDSPILISRMNLSRKQYYHRINRLRSLGLISRKKARYSLTSLGRILYETQKTVEIAVQNRWKLVALDSLETSLSAEGMPVEERIILINVLLGDREEIKDMLLCSSSYVKK